MVHARVQHVLQNGMPALGLNARIMHSTTEKQGALAVYDKAAAVVGDVVRAPAHVIVGEGIVRGREVGGGAAAEQKKRENAKVEHGAAVRATIAACFS